MAFTIRRLGIRAGAPLLPGGSISSRTRCHCMSVRSVGKATTDNVTSRALSAVASYSYTGPEPSAGGDRRDARGLEGLQVDAALGDDRADLVGRQRAREKVALPPTAAERDQRPHV